MSDFSVLTDPQRIAATTLDRPVALVAGAGSGKTTVLVRRYLELLKREVQPHQILALTFTNEAASELKIRIARTLGETGQVKLVKQVENSTQIGTLHSYCYQLISDYGSAIELPEIESIASPFQTASYFEAAYQEWLNALPKEDLKKFLVYYSHLELREFLQSLFARRHRLRFNPEEPVKFFLAQAASLFAALEKQMKSEGLYTFDDLEHYALKILQEKPEITKRLQTTTKAILIDEFQDTSKTQWEILSHLIGSDWNRLFIVGDPKQSIYGFRHAEVKLFTEVSEAIRVRNGLVLELEQNFRTHEPLLGRINQLSREVFEGAEVPFSEMSSGRLEKPSSDGLEVIRYAAPTDAKRADLQSVEIESVVRRVTDLLAAGAKPGSIALLFRMGDRIPLYAKAVEKLGVRVRSKQILSLFQSYDVLDILSYLKALHRPEDDYAFAAFLGSRYIGFTFQDFRDLNQMPGEKLFEKARTRETLRWFYRLIDKKESSVETALSTLFRHSHYFPEQTEAVLTLFEPLCETGLTVEKALSQTKAWEREEILFEANSGVPSSDAVTLLTVHGAKGLEYDHVLLVDNLRQLPRRSPLLIVKPGLPMGIKYRENDEWVETKPYAGLRQVLDRTDKEEAKRILYVALTRARESLTLFLPQTESLPKGSWAEQLDSIKIEFRV